MKTGLLNTLNLIIMAHYNVSAKYEHIVKVMCLLCRKNKDGDFAVMGERCCT